MDVSIRVCVALWLATTAVAQFTVTSNYVISKTTDEAFTRTSTLPLRPVVAPTGEVISVTTSTRSYNGLEIVMRYFEPGEFASTDIQLTTSGTNLDGSFTYYYQGIVYTAPASCPTPFTVSTRTRIMIPSEVRSQFSPTSLASRTGTHDNGAVYTQVTAYLSDGAVRINAADASSDWLATYYLADCRNPTATDDSYWGNLEPGTSRDDPVNDWLNEKSSVKPWAIALAAVFPSLFLLGFVESWFWFRRMMVGRGALRVGTICWILILPLLLLFVRYAPARRDSDQSELRIRWKTFSLGTRVKLWLRWGFRKSYPTELLGTKPSSSLQPRNSAVEEVEEKDSPFNSDGTRRRPPSEEGDVVWITEPGPSQIITR
ncbi:Hypothetical protein NCS54_00860400 [Fusarium falciforme]|uniref:Hypothetical protein n=1 Tax=Fusarium falciforme TaxID=195108 RepID=UPI0023015A03|nr:Hypothetical protein NCS54_00860400 [Fusarium falciforme]WAO91149.1 Hypothetical protein NCS54_00860400 [Fusarium falciforme]